MIKMQQDQVLKQDPQAYHTDQPTCLIWLDWTRWTGPHIGIVTDFKQMSWDMKAADMKYHATMAEYEGVPLPQRRKKNDKAFCWDNVCVVCVVFLVSFIK